jgi:hypothetical protein
MQGLFGRFGKQQPEPASPQNGNPRQNLQSAAPTDMFADFDDRDWDNPAARDSPEERLRQRQRDFPIASQFDTDDEETNWDDAEVSDNDNNPLTRSPNRRIDYAQPQITVIESPNVSNSSDLDDWAEALPAATVKNSNIREARRGQKVVPISPNEDLWDDIHLDSQELTSRSTSSTTGNSSSTKSTPVNRAVGLWASILQQFRRFLPGPLQQLSDAILTATAILFVTVGIWFVDSLFMPGIESMIAKPPAAPVAVLPDSPIATSPAVVVSPEQAFIEALETQISEITSQYPDDLVQTLDVDPDSDRLLVKLNPVWYSLDDDRQNSLADRMWLQAQANHFTKLEIQDSQGVSIARSPVVGKHPIILHRRLS